MKAFNSFDSNLKRNLLLLFAAGLLFWSSLGSLLATLPLYIESLGATKQEIGIVMGGFAIGMLILRPQLGILADRRGRKIVLLIGVTAVAIAPLGYLMVKSLLLLLVIRAFHGISLAAFGTGFLALVGDLAPEHRRGEIIGYMSLVNPIGIAFGPALGGYVLESLGYTALFLTSTAFGLLGLLCILPIINPPIIAEPEQIKKNGFWQVFISPPVFVPAIVLLIIGLTLGAVHTFIALYIKSTGVDLNAGWFFTAAAISSFSVRLIIGPASDKYGRGLFVTFSLIAYSVAMILIWQADSVLTFLLGAFIEGIGAGSAIPMISALMTDRALPHERARTFGVTLTGFDMGLVIAGPILGFVAKQIGYRSMFGFASGLILLAIVVFLTQSNHNLSHSLRFALGRGQDAYAMKRYSGTQE